MKIAKWGNSLAVRIPSDLAQKLELKEGDSVDLTMLETGALAIVTDQQRRAAIMEEIRRLAKPLPPGYKFDREEANAR